MHVVTQLTFTVRFRHQNHTVRIKKRSWFGLKKVGYLRKSYVTKMNEVKLIH